MKHDFVMPIAVLTIICIVVAGALALMNSFTAPVIDAAAADRAFVSMTQKIPDATGFTPVSTDGLPRAIRAVYSTDNNVGYIFIISVNGFSGEIRVMCAIDNDGRIVSSSTLQHTETQGIGTILDQASFTGQFDGKDESLDDVFTVTGATISTAAYKNAIREAFAAFDIVTGG